MKLIIPSFFLLLLGILLQAQTPNIVIIVCDDLNDTIDGIGGHPQAYTPNGYLMIRQDRTTEFKQK